MTPEKKIERRGGAREGAGAPEKLTKKTAYSIRFSDATVARVERFAKSRKLDRTAALEQIIEEYTMVLDGVILPGRWHTETHPRPGLKSLRSMYPKSGRQFADALI